MIRMTRREVWIPLYLSGEQAMVFLYDGPMWLMALVGKGLEMGGGSISS